jgi:hypothetical protein
MASFSRLTCVFTRSKSARKRRARIDGAADLLFVVLREPQIVFNDGE